MVIGLPFFSLVYMSTIDLFRRDSNDGAHSMLSGTSVPAMTAVVVTSLANARFNCLRLVASLKG